MCAVKLGYISSDSTTDLQILEVEEKSYNPDAMVSGLN
jgi:hypothetical protein